MGSGSVTMKPLRINIKDQVTEMVKKAGQATAADIRAGSPRRTAGGNAYAEGWTTTVVGESAMVHNAGKKKSLGHLLENGHATKNGGFVGPQEHIRPAYIKNKAIFLEEMKSIKLKPTN